MTVGNLEPDLKTKYCHPIIEWTKIYIVCGFNQEPEELRLYAELPLTVEEYWDFVSGKARTDWRKAVKSGCTVRRVVDITPINDDIISIFDSIDVRQGRPINKQHVNLYFQEASFTDAWLIQDYSRFSCEKHNLQFWIVEKHGRVVAFLELVNCGNLAVVRTVLGHVDFWKYGIMKYLFIEVGNSCLKNNVRFFHYGYKSHLLTNQRFFLRDLRFDHTITEVSDLPKQLQQSQTLGWPENRYKTS